MKICNILSEVVLDFNKFKQAKQKPVQTQANLSQHDNTMATVSDNLDLLIDYIKDLKSEVRIPHFNNFDTIFSYIYTTLRYPFNKDDVEAWYAQLQPNQQAMVSMIAHHSSRLLKVLNTMEEKVNEFIKSVPKLDKMPSMVRIHHLQSIIKHDRSVLEELERLIY